MVQFSNSIKTAVAYRSGAMETGDDFKNGANPKIQTNKRNSSVFLLVVILVTAGLFLDISNLNAQYIKGWVVGGTNESIKNYKTGLDKSTYKKTGSNSFCFKSINKRFSGEISLKQTCLANDYWGKKVKFTAYIKTRKLSDSVDMQILSLAAPGEQQVMSFDILDERIKGKNDWTKYELMLYIPENSNIIQYGITFWGAGKVWFGNVSFEIADETEAEFYANISPVNNSTAESYTLPSGVNHRPINLKFVDFD